MTAVAMVTGGEMTLRPNVFFPGEGSLTSRTGATINLHMERIPPTAGGFRLQALLVTDFSPRLHYRPSL
uniref:Uncharacterized protein n=1 Tax=Pyxicephalus adspersus TaxID=30357 RepID=A0AAV2ZK82_PYXAD|nr:TPA: hypothetical protein GDO54_005027 [Pyxicephalus adspersus]